MEFEQVLDSLTFKRMTALRKKIQSVVGYFLNHCFWWNMQSLGKF